MDLFTLDEKRHIMDHPENIRNVLYCPDYSNTDGFHIPAILCRITGTNETDEEIAALIANSGIQKNVGLIGNDLYSYYYEHQRSTSEKKQLFLINMCSFPEFVNPNLRMSPTVAVTDGALFTIDPARGFTKKSEQTLRYLVKAKVKPVLMFTSFEKYLTKDEVSFEVIYQKIKLSIAEANHVISQYSVDEISDIAIDPIKGNVAFGSERDEWAFTLLTFARIYSSKFNIEEDKLVKKFWGNNYYSPNAKKWIHLENENEKLDLERTFIKFCLEPIQKLARTALTDNQEHIQKLVKAINLSMAPDELKGSGPTLIKKILSKWLNISTNLLDMIVLHLPSPVTAQKYRASVLCNPEKDQTTYRCIQECDPQGPLLIYIYKVVPVTNSKEYMALGRIFSGKLSSGQQVRIMGPEYQKGNKYNLIVHTTKTIFSVFRNLATGVDYIQCGNIIGIEDVGSKLLTPVTVATSEELQPMLRKTILDKFPYLYVALEPVKPEDLPRVEDAMQCVKRSDFEGCVWVDEFGQHLIGGVDGSHLNLLVKKIKEVAKCEIKLTDPLSSYREIVSEKSQEVLSKLHLTRFQCTGQPLQEELAFLIETDMSFAQNELLRTERLTKEFNWSLRDANNLYAIDSERFGPNLLVNQTPEDHCKLVFEYRDSM